MEQLKVAMVAPPWFELPPTAYGGIESMCADLTDQLTRRGVGVTLIGVGRNRTLARFIAVSLTAQQERIGQALPEVVHAVALPDLLDRLDVDVVHDHSLAGPLLARGRDLPTVVTAHGPVTGEMGRYYRHLGRSVHLVALSDAQRVAVPSMHWAGTVHNAVKVGDFPYCSRKKDFALFLGRATPEKGIPAAITAARAAGVRLLIAAKCREPDERKYFHDVVKPMLGNGVEWLGEVNRTRKLSLLAAARCLLFPIQWAEPFGIVMAEALACGTPVVALRRGSVPEVVVHGRTGFVCDSVAELISGLRDVESLSPLHCRSDARDRFDVDLMASRYESLYRSVADQAGRDVGQLSTAAVARTNGNGQMLAVPVAKWRGHTGVGSKSTGSHAP